MKLECRRSSEISFSYIIFWSKFNLKSTTANTAKIVIGTDSLEMKAWVTTKKSQLVEFLAKSKGNMDCRQRKKENTNCSYDHVTTCRNEDWSSYEHLFFTLTRKCLCSGNFVVFLFLMFLIFKVRCYNFITLI